MAAFASYENELLMMLERQLSPARSPHSEQNSASQPPCTLNPPTSATKTTNKPRHPRSRRNRPRTFLTICNTTDMLMCLIGIPFAWITYLITLPWVIPSIHWSSVLAFFFLPLWMSKAIHLWRSYRRYRVSMAIADDEAVIGLLDADEVLEDGLDLYAVGYQDGERFVLRKGEGVVDDIACDAVHAH